MSEVVCRKFQFVRYKASLNFSQTAAIFHRNPSLSKWGKNHFNCIIDLMLCLQLQTHHIESKTKLNGVGVFAMYLYILYMEWEEKWCCHLESLLFREIRRTNR